MWERNIDGLPLLRSQVGIWLATQACALTGNRTVNLLVHWPMLSPLSHTCQDMPCSYICFFYLLNCCIRYVLAKLILTHAITQDGLKRFTLSSFLPELSKWKSWDTWSQGPCWTTAWTSLPQEASGGCHGPGPIAILLWSSIMDIGYFWTPHSRSTPPWSLVVSQGSVFPLSTPTRDRLPCQYSGLEGIGFIPPFFWGYYCPLRTRQRLCSFFLLEDHSLA